MVYENGLRNYVRGHDPYKTMEPDRLHLRVLRAFSGVLARSLSVIFENCGNLWRSLIMEKKEILYPSSKTKKCRPVSLTVIHKKTMEPPKECFWT